MESGPLDSAFPGLRDWDPAWAEAYTRMATNPWNSGVLPRKFIELVCIGLNAACTNLNPEGTRRHIRAALQAGATRDEILFILKCAAVMSLHSCSLGAPITLEEAKAAGVEHTPKAGAATPFADKMKAVGQWNVAWDPFMSLDAGWTDEYMAAGIGVYSSGLLTPKEIELLSIAFDASFTHMYAPGTRRHIKGALAAGASVQEIMEILKLCVAQGAQALNLGVPILVEELERAK